MADSGGAAEAVARDTLVELYRMSVLIRRFEELLPPLYRSGVITGTGHLYIGQEVVAATVGSLLHDEDVVFSNHRGHGHFLAATNDAAGLLAELCGRPEGVCGGRGGTQHLCVPHRFYSNGILGGMVGCAVGYAAAVAARREQRLVVAFLGDGALGEGIVYEAANIAALRRLPVLFVVEDNGWSQSTRKADHLAGDVAARFSAFGMPVLALAGAALWREPSVRALVERVRIRTDPAALVVEVPRLTGHSVNSAEPSLADAPADPLEALRQDVGGAADDVDAAVNRELAALFAEVEPLELQHA
jgi:TPP-dependent pyruvate/acetoin dehydrogenase alpha subunit